ncbi:MAG: DNA topoisomerase I [Planctomycetaceae bacterium]|nr:DNA topoisomerase I [Planctomycetaceae bacterium]
MGELIQLLLPTKLLALLMKPFVRLIISLIAAPLCRLFLHRVVRKKEMDAELERDITLWLRGSLLLLIATANMEGVFFKWVPPEFRDEKIWLIALRLMLAIGVIEGMPDQALFAIIHPGPPKPDIDRRRPWASLREYLPKFGWGILCQHFNRSSPVLAILTVFFQGPIGWICYGLALTNYLIIGLVSSRDRAIDVLQQFDRAVAEQRKELVEELAPATDSPLSPEQQILAAEQGGVFTPPVPSEPAE